MHNHRARCILGLTVLSFCATAFMAGPSLGQTCAPVGPCGDVDATGSVNTSDALKVLKTAVGQPQELSCQCSDGEGTCEEDLVTCTGDLSTCGGNLANCSDDLGACETKFDACQVDLSSTNADLDSCLSQPSCGNGELEAGEDCEDGVVLIATCTSVGFAGGQLRCGPACEWNTAGCYESRFELTTVTILDHETGLQWARKNGADGAPDYGNVHDVDNVYEWSDSGSVVFSPRGVSSTGTDGSMFLFYLAVLNGADDGEGFAGHSDWRIPTIEELASIAVLDPDCEMSPCVPTADFLPNRAAPYWSMTTDPMVPGFAKALDYDGGQIESGLKTNSAHVRAVRTGLDTGS